MCLASVEKLVKELMPPNVKCAPETRQLIAECCLGPACVPRPLCHLFYIPSKYYSQNSYIW